MWRCECKDPLMITQAVFFTPCSVTLQDSQRGHYRHCSAQYIFLQHSRVARIQSEDLITIEAGDGPAADRPNHSGGLHAVTMLQVVGDTQTSTHN